MAGKEVILSVEMNDLLTQVARNRGVSKEDALIKNGSGITGCL